MRVSIAYAYATRWLSISPLSSLSIEEPDYDEARHVISKLVPFLVDRKSKTLLSSLSSAATAVLSRFDPVCKSVIVGLAGGAE